MTVYTDSLSNLKNYGDDFYKIAVTTFLSYSLQTKIDAWFNDVSPSRVLFGKLEQKKISWDEFVTILQGNGYVACKIQNRLDQGLFKKQ